MAPTLATLPGEVLCLVFEELCLQDMIALRKSRLQFLQIYLRYEQQLRRKQLDKIQAALERRLVLWARAQYASMAPAYQQRHTEQRHVNGLLSSLQYVWEMTQKGTSFKECVTGRMPILASHRQPYSPYFAMDWRQEVWEGEDSEKIYDHAKEKEAQVAFRLDLIEKNVIALTDKAEVILDISSFKVYWLPPYDCWKPESAYFVTDGEVFFGSTDWKQIPGQIVINTVPAAWITHYERKIAQETGKQTFW